MLLGIQEFSSLKTLLEKEKDEVKACMENLFTSAGILKIWAHEEQKYCEETISYTNEKIQSLECTIAALNDTNLKLKRVFVQVPDGKKSCWTSQKHLTGSTSTSYFKN